MSPSRNGLRSGIPWRRVIDRRADSIAVAPIIEWARKGAMRNAKVKDEIVEKLGCHAGTDVLNQHIERFRRKKQPYAWPKPWPCSLICPVLRQEPLMHQRMSLFRSKIRLVTVGFHNLCLRRDEASRCAAPFRPMCQPSRPWPPNGGLARARGSPYNRHKL